MNLLYQKTVKHQTEITRNYHNPQQYYNKLHRLHVSWSCCLVLDYMYFWVLFSTNIK